MESLTIYFLKVNIIVSSFYFFYYLFFKKEKFFLWNRILLLAAVILSFTLPLIPLDNIFNFSNNRPVLFHISKLYEVSAKISTIPNHAVVDMQKQGPPIYQGFPIFNITAQHLIVILYLLVSVLLVIRLTIQMLKVLQIIKRSKKYRLKGIVYCNPQKNTAVFSYFNYIVINEENYNAEQYKQIIQHEEAHCKQWHSIDILLIEILHVLLWINPLVLLLKKHLKLNLEYMADEAVIASGIHVKNYQYYILEKSMKSANLFLANSFNASKIKQRIWMINKERPSNIRLLKYSTLIPLLFSIYIILQSSYNIQKPESNNALYKLYSTLTGYYQFINAKHVLIHIINRDGKLVLEQLWNNEKIIFEEKDNLEFYNEHRDFPLKFIKAGDGTIRQLLAFDKDLWNKVDDYKAFRKHEMKLPQVQLRALEGYYQFGKEPKYFQIISNHQYLILKELWTGKKIKLFSESPFRFFSKQGIFPLEFICEEDGNITKAIAFDKDVWYKVKDYRPPLKRIVALTDTQLTSYVGKYSSRTDWILTFKKEGKHLRVFANGEDHGVILAESQSKFFMKGDPTTTVEFIKTLDGTYKARLMQEGIPIDAKRIL